MSSGSVAGHSFGPFVLNLDRLSLQEGGSDRELRPKAFDVLLLLVEHGGRLVTKDEIVKAVWPKVVVNDDAIAQCIRDIRKVLGDEGDRFIRTVPRRGYMFVADVEPLALRGSSGREPTRAVHQRRLTAALAIVGALLALGVVLFWFPGSRSGTHKQIGPSVAVLPFDAGTVEQAYLGEGLAEDVAAAVSRFQDLIVISPHSSFQYTPLEEDLRKVGRDLGVRYVLRGSVRRESDRLRITAQLIGAEDLATLWIEQYDRPYAAVLSIPDEIAGKVAAQLVGHVRNDIAQSSSGRDPSSLEAYELVLRARKAYGTFTKSGAIEALDLAQHAAVIDPGSGSAWDLVARTLLQFYLQPYDENWRSRAQLEKAQVAAYRAVALKPDWSTARSTLGYVHLWLREYDAGLEAARQAIALNPNDTVAVVTYAEALAFTGDQRGAVEAWNQAKELDPFSPPVNLALTARSYTFLGEPNKALELARSCVAIAPTLQPCLLQLAIAAKAAGRDDEARSTVARLIENNPSFSVKFQVDLVPFRHSEDSDKFADLMRRAGLPD